MENDINLEMLILSDTETLAGINTNVSDCLNLLEIVLIKPLLKLILMKI